MARAVTPRVLTLSNPYKSTELFNNLSLIGEKEGGRERERERERERIIQSNAIIPFSIIDITQSISDQIIHSL